MENSKMWVVLQDQSWEAVVMGRYQLISDFKLNNEHKFTLANVISQWFLTQNMWTL